MSRQPLLRLRMVGRAAIGVLGVATALLLAPTAMAQPEVEATDAITAAWEASGGDTGPLGASVGDVYPVGGGFAQDFASGKMYFTPQTGAHYMQGAILEKLPGPPLLTRDQVLLLESDNVVSEGAKTLADLGIEATACEAIIPAYLQRFRRGGGFSTAEV